MSGDASGWRAAGDHASERGVSGAQAEAPASVARAAVEEKEAKAAAEQVVGAAAKRLASRTTVLGMGGGTRGPAGAVGGSVSAHVLLADALAYGVL